jgi:galactokinase
MKTVVRAPGRVNLIGEHTDYNDGFVLPMAIDRWTRIEAQPRKDRRVVLHSRELCETAEFSLDALEPGATTGWISYAHGVAGALAEHGCAIQGWEGTVTSDVPIGAGLSSSASFTLAVARAFAALSALAWEPAVMARLCLRAENHWIGLQSGIMDQLISACGIAGHALLIDCRALTMHPLPLPPGTCIVVLDTGIRRGLVDSAYNERHAECALAAQMCGVSSLRDAGPSLPNTLKGIALRRARHVVTENTRTLAAAEAMQRGDARQLGELMDQSHASLRDDFEVSCGELDAIVECARARAGCLGARMTGAGFGGCAIALVETAQAASFVAGMAAAFEHVATMTPRFHVCQPSGGAEVVASEE